VAKVLTNHRTDDRKIMPKILAQAKEAMEVNELLADGGCNVIAPFVSAPGNKNEGTLLKSLLGQLKSIAKKIGLKIVKSIMSLDGVYNSRSNRKAIFNAGMKPNIPENKGNRKKAKRGKKQIFSKSIFKKRFSTIEGVFAWEDKFKRLLLRFERHSIHHYAMKTIGSTMINLRHFCRC